MWTVPVEVLAAMDRGESGLRRWRMLKGWTQGELAARLGLSQGYLCDLEHGKRSPTLDVVQRLAAALGGPVGTMAEVVLFGIERRKP